MIVNLCNAFIMVIIILVYKNDIFAFSSYYTFVTRTTLAYVFIIFYYMQIRMSFTLFFQPLACVICATVVNAYYLIELLVQRLLPN